MSYTVEVSFDLRKRTQVSTFSAQVEELARAYDCSAYYDFYECEGRGRIVDRNHCVFVSEYEGEEDAAAFIGKVKRLPYLHVESVYQEGGKYVLIHASPKYLRKMDTLAVRAFRTNRKATGVKHALISGALSRS